MTSEEIHVWREKVLEPVLRGEPVDEAEAQRAGGLALLSADTDKIKEYVFESAKLPEIRGASMILDELNQGWPRRDYQPGDPQPPSNLREVFIQRGLPTRRYEGDKEDDCIIYAGGGSLLALVPSDLAGTLQADIEALYPRETGAATITCVCLEVGSEEIEGGYRPGAFPVDRLQKLDTLSIKLQRRIADYYGKKAQREIDEAAVQSRKHFGELVKIQALRLRRAKEEKKAVPFVEAIPYARRCQSCGKRPANILNRDLPEVRYLCTVCEKKCWRSRQRKGKKYWTERLEEHLSGAPELQQKYYGSVHPESVAAANDVEEIGQVSKKEGYIGFIYADGNKVGEWVESSRTSAGYKAKSELLREFLPSLVYGALGRHLKVQEVTRTGKDKVCIHPLEIITVGGDDLLLIVPGDRALAIARDICQQFEQELPSRLERVGLSYPQTPLTISAGVVIAEHHNPIYFLRDLSEALLKSAKKRAKTERTEEGTIDFLVLKSQTMLSTDLKHLRSVWPWQQDNPDVYERLFLTRRPYTLSELQRLMGLAQEAKQKGFPRTQLYVLQESVMNQGRLPSSIYFLYQYVRQRDDDKKEFFQKLLWNELNLTDKSVVAGAFPVESPPWRRRKSANGESTEYDTVLADLLEILDFAEEGWQCK